MFSRGHIGKDQRLGAAGGRGSPGHTLARIRNPEAESKPHADGESGLRLFSTGWTILGSTKG